MTLRKFIVLLLGVTTIGIGQTLKSNLWVTNGDVRAIVRSGHAIYLGGNFTQVGPSTGTGVVLNTTGVGQYDPTWPKVNGQILVAIPDGGGGWYIGGDFTNVGGIPRSRIARILSNKTVSSWNPNANGRVAALVLHGAHVYAGGDFTTIGGQPRSRIAAIRVADGTANAWNPGANGGVLTFAPSSNLIYVGGNFTVIGGLARNFVAALDTTTPTPTTFNANPNGPVYSIALGINSLYLGGSFSSVGGRGRNNLASVDFAGGVQGYDPAPNGAVWALRLIGNNILYVAGEFTLISGVTRNRLAAIGAFTPTALTWNPNVDGAVYSLLINNLDVYIGGSFSTVGGLVRNNIARLDTFGNLSSWSPSAGSAVNALALFGGTVYAGGSFATINTIARNNLAVLDDSLGSVGIWNPNVTGGFINSLALSGSTLYAGGTFTTVGTQARSKLAAVSALTGLATPWNPNPNGDVNALALSSGRVYVGGIFTSIGGAARNRIAAIDSATGTAISTWNPNANSDVLALSISGSTVYAGGTFTTMGSLIRNKIAAINISTGVATTWNPNGGTNLEDFVKTFALSNGVIYAGGNFSNIGGQTRNAVVALDSVTGNAMPFDIGLVSGTLVNVLTYAAGNVYVGGLLMPGLTSDLISVNPITGISKTWDPKVLGHVHALAVTDTTVYAGGLFQSALGEFRPGFAGFVDPSLSIPIFSANPPILNFSTVLVGQSRTDSVLVSNVGGGTLTISSATSNNARYTVAPSSASIPPGASRRFLVTFTPTGVGPQNATISFVYNAPGSPSIVSASGTGIAPAFSVVPGVLPFGNVLVNSNKTDSVTVTNGGTAPLNISNVTSSHGRFSVTPTLAQIAPASSRRFYVTFSPNTTGPFNANITFTHDATGSPTAVPVSGTGTVPGFSVAPDSLAFGNVRVNTARRDSLTVTNTGTSILNISDVTASDIRFVVEPTNAQIAPLANRKFYVTFSPNTTESYVANLAFTHDAGGSPSLVPLSGAGAVPVFSVTPTSLTFGSVPVTTNKRDSLIVRNTGTWPLTVDSAVSTNGRFSVVPRIAQIAPGAAQKFFVTFSPIATGNVGGSIVFAHDASGSPVEVIVAGTGVAASISIDPDSINFGSVVVNTTKVDSFAVINPGTADLIISSVLSTNGMFSVTPPSATVPPLGSVRFRVTFLPTSTGGKIGSIVIAHSAIGSPDTVLVSGEGVAAGFLVNPSNLSFGSVLVGSTKRDSVTVTNNGGAMLNINGVSSSHARFSVAPTSAQIPPSGSQKFYVTFLPTTSGTVNGVVTFIHDAAGSPTNVNVSGTGLAPLFSANPPSLNFGNVRVGVNKKDSLTVMNSGSATLTVSGVSSSNPRFTVSPTNAVIAPLDTRRFYVEFTPDTTGPSNAELLFIHNAEGSPSALPVSGVGVVPLFSVSPGSKDFGSVAVNSTSVDSVNVTNSGGAPLTISSVTSSSDEFDVFPSASVVPPSSNRWFTVTFMPASTGPKATNIMFMHDATGSPDSVTATGTGILSTFSLSRSSIDFGNVKVGRTRVDSVRVTNTGNFAIAIASASTSDSVFSVVPQTANIPSEGSQTFLISFSPKVRGSTNGSLRFIHNAAGSPTSVALSGHGLAPSFVLSRQSISFGSVRVGTEKQDTISIVNAGDDTLFIHQTVSSNPQFGAVLLDSVIFPAARQVARVRFAPTSASAFEANIGFVHNAPGSPTSVAVFGLGTAPLLLALPRTVAFGDVSPRDSAFAQVQMINIGSVSLTVDSLRIHGRNAGEFFVVGSSGPFLPVAPLETLKVNLRFSPNAVDTLKSAFVVVYSNALAGTDSLLLRGRSSSSQILVTLAGDTTAGSTLRIGATPPEGFTPDRALLFYRVAGRRVFDSLSLFESGLAYEASFPDSVITIRGVEYYIAFSNAERRVTNPNLDPTNNPAIVQIKTLSTFTAQTFVSRQYRMVSIPLELGSPTAQNQLFDDYEPYNPLRWRLFRWEENRNIEFDSIAARFTPGAAFWLVTQSGAKFDADNGRSVRSVRPFTIPLMPGWNQIAAPFAFPIAWDSIGNSTLLRKPYFWDGAQYVPNIRQLTPWEGYFVLNDSEQVISLSIPAREAPTQFEKISVLSLHTDASDCAVRFSAASGSLRDEYNYIGFAAAATQGRDLLDLPEPPQIQDYVQVSFVEDGQRYLANFKPEATDGQQWRMIVTSSVANQEVRVLVEKIGLLPEGFDLFVLDEDQFNIVPLTGATFNVRVGARNSIRSFRIILGTKEFAERASNGIPLVPLEFSLEQNYPNPFNPSTSIRYTLGKRSDVVLEVYDMLGQITKTLVHGEQLTGAYTVEFDGTNNGGASLASGVYIYRLRAGEFVESKKLLLLR